MQLMDKISGALKNRGIIRSSIINVSIKPIGMLISFIYTPILLNYLGTEQYGVWATILSVINWITYFDVGIGNGMRNILSAEIAVDDKYEARKTVSTAYVCLGVIVIIVLIGGICLGGLLDWKSILNTDLPVESVLFISFVFICLNFILSLQKVEFCSMQKSEFTAVFGVIVQMLNLVGVILLGVFSTSEKLVAFSFLFGISSVVANCLFSCLLWSKRPYLIPKISLFDKSKLQDICSLGIKFFLIQISALLLFSTDNVIISHLYTPEYVTPYNTAYKAFGIINSFFSAAIAPLWSRYTAAKEHGDFLWMRNVLKKIKLIWLVISLLVLAVVPVFKPLVSIWLRRELDYEDGLVLAMAIYYISLMYSSIYSSFYNGIGEINVELICSILMAVLNIPFSVFLAVNCGMGTTGVCMGTALSLILENGVFRVQQHFIFKKELRKPANKKSSVF